MSEPRRVPPQYLNDPKSPANTGPRESLDREALAIIERAAMEMAGRKPPKVSVEPRLEPVVDPAIESTAEPADVMAEQTSSSATEMSARAHETLTETQPAEASTTQELPVQDWSAQELPADEIKPAEELQPPEFMPAAPFDPADEIKPAQVEEPTEKPIEEIKPRADIKLVEQFDPTPIVQPTAPIAPIPMAPVQAAPAAPAFRPMFDDHFRLSFTSVQSAALVVAILALVLGAFGMAAHGWVTAHDWSCRMGLVTSSCPPAGGYKPLARPEIPT